MNKEILENGYITSVWGKKLSKEDAFLTVNNYYGAVGGAIACANEKLQPDEKKRFDAVAAIGVEMHKARYDKEEDVCAWRKAKNMPEGLDGPKFLATNADSGDETYYMPGRVIEFTDNRTEKELDYCPIMAGGDQICRFYIATVFGQIDSNGGCAPDCMTYQLEALGERDQHCRVVCERLPKGHELCKKRDTDIYLGRSKPQYPAHPSAPGHERATPKILEEDGIYTSPWGAKHDFNTAYTTSVMFSVGGSALARVATLLEPDTTKRDKVIDDAAWLYSMRAMIYPGVRDAIRKMIGAPKRVKDARAAAAYADLLDRARLLDTEFVQFNENGVEQVVHGCTLCNSGGGAACAACVGMRQGELDILAEVGKWKVTAVERPAPDAKPGCGPAKTCRFVYEIRTE